MEISEVAHEKSVEVHLPLILPISEKIARHDAINRLKNFAKDNSEILKWQGLSEKFFLFEVSDRAPLFSRRNAKNVQSDFGEVLNIYRLSL